MDQIIFGVDTHKSNHVAVAINTQGARLVPDHYLGCFRARSAAKRVRSDRRAKEPGVRCILSGGCLLVHAVASQM